MNWKDELRIRTLGMILDDIIYDLRDKEGLSLYQFAAGGNYNRLTSRYEIQFRFNCLPEQLSVIREKTKNLIGDLKSGDTPIEVFNTQKTNIRSIYNSQALNHSSYMSKRLYRHYSYGEPMVESQAIEDYLKNLTFQDIIETARKYLIEDLMYEVKMEAEFNNN
jgi:predicted Zn-dependent peptidase